jgi:hypothetical protein
VAAIYAKQGDEFVEVPGSIATGRKDTGTVRGWVT